VLDPRTRGNGSSRDHHLDSVGRAQPLSVRSAPQVSRWRFWETVGVPHRLGSSTSSRRALVAAIALASGAGLLVAASLPVSAASGAKGTLMVRTLKDPAITESSGLARSEYSRTRLWTHNDSGGGDYIYAIGARGQTVGRFTLVGASHVDWEAMSNVHKRGVNYLYLGDIGDNASKRSSIFVHRVRDPRLSQRNHRLHPTTWQFKYPDGAHNAETLLVRSGSLRIYIVTKGKGSRGAIYEAPRRLSRKHVNMLRRIGSAPEGMSDGVFLGRNRFLLRGYVSGWLYRRFGASPVRFPLPIKGESVARGWWPGTVLIGQEGRDSQVWQVRLP
jgi:hypothetical protein